MIQRHRLSTPAGAIAPFLLLLAIAGLGLLVLLAPG